MDKKRILILIGFLVATILIGWLIWRVFFAAKVPRSTLGPTTPGTPDEFPGVGPGEETAIDPDTGIPPVTVVGPGTPDNTGAQIIPGGPVKQLTDMRVRGLAKDLSGGGKFYNEQDGKFYRIRADGTLEPMSDEVFFNVSDVTWSSADDGSIIEYPDGSNIYYNFQTKEKATLPKHWEDFSFSPLGNSIAAKSIGFSAENRWLITSEPSGNNIKLVEPLGSNGDKVAVDWSPNNQIVATALTGDQLGADRQELLFIGLNSENFKSTVIEGRGLVTEWSPAGDRLLYSVYSAASDFKPELWIVNAQGESIGSSRKLLNVQTWADKCTFGDNRFVYCAVPNTLPTGIGFQPALANNTSDSIIKIDLTTGLKQALPDADTQAIDTLFVGDSGKTLYYTQKNSAGIFSIPL